MGRFKNNQSGFSLVNILIAVALSAIAASVIGAMSIFVNQRTSAIKRQSEFLSLESDILKITHNEIFCSNAFWSGSTLATYAGVTTNLSHIKLEPTTILAAGTNLPHGVRVNTIQIVSKDAVGKTAASYRRWDADLVLRFSDLSKTPVQQITKTFPLLLITGPSSNAIAACGEKKEAVSTNDGLGYGCDMQTSPAGNTSTYLRNRMGKNFDVLYYGTYSNGMIHDGGGSGRRDSAAFYCVRETTNPGRYGYLSTCLSREGCLWR